MSEITLFQGSNVAIPDYLKEGDNFSAQTAGTIGVKSISIEGGVWRMMSGGEEIARNEDRAMNFVIVHGQPEASRSYYDSVYVKGQVSTPACYSVDGKRPAEDAEKPQSSACATCKQNIKGSGSGDSRACRFFQRIAVVLEGDMEGDVYRLQIPSKSIYGDADSTGKRMGYKAYSRHLRGHGVPLSGVVTEVRFDTSESVPVLKFSALRPLKREEWEAAKRQNQTEAAARAIEVSFGGKRTVSTAPALENSAGVPETRVEAPEPVKRTTKKAEPAAPASGKSVDDLINEWGTDDE